MAHELNTKKGYLGETIVLKYLENKGFKLLERNYRKPWGEIDLVLLKDKIIHIVEVKSVTCEIISNDVSYEKLNFNPEDNMHEEKKNRLKRVIETYIAEKNWGDDFQVDLVLVFMDTNRKMAKINFISNIEL